jgi:hypothetical protein
MFIAGNRDDLKRRLAFDTVCSRVYIRPTNIVPGTLRYPVDIPSLPADNLFPAIHQEFTVQSHTTAGHCGL